MKRTWTEQQLIEAVLSSLSVREVLRKLGLVPTGGNYHTVNFHTKRLNLDTSHFTGRGWNVGSRYRQVSYSAPIESFLVKDRLVTSSDLRRKLINANILPNECSICSIRDWQNAPLTLHLDHINGDHFDNRLENLRLLCPNCHSQTSTYCGRGITKRISSGIVKQTHGKYLRDLPLRTHKIIEPKFCVDCQCSITRHAVRCSKCLHKTQQKIQWPSDQELIEMVHNMNWVQIGKQLGVSDNAVKKHLRTQNIDYKTIRKGHKDNHKMV